MGPIAILQDWGDGVGFLAAFIIGIGFGFALERAGFGNSKKLAMQFYFRDLTVFKVMFTAIITAMTGIIFLGAFGILDISSIYINPTYLWPGLAGGLIMGLGFVIGGYCPGTSVVGLSTFKMDAVFYITGALFGMFVFGEIAPFIQGFFKGEFSGYYGTITIYQALGVSSGVIGFLVILMALGGFWGSEWLEKKFGEGEAK
ncbi:MAG: YeeE/YedE family protein [bacterium]|nr:YeeE/YedE family protein [bacterium]